MHSLPKLKSLTHTNYRDLIEGNVSAQVLGPHPSDPSPLHITHLIKPCPLIILFRHQRLNGLLSHVPSRPKEGYVGQGKPNGEDHGYSIKG